MPNSDLIDLDPATVLDVKLDKMRKTLQAAHELAAKHHPLSYYKELLQNFQEDLIQQEKAKAAKAATPKGKKSKAVDDDGDVEMADAADSDETPAKDKKAKKRKAEESAEVSCSKGPWWLWHLLTVTDTSALRLGEEAQDQAYEQLRAQDGQRSVVYSEGGQGK